MPTISMFYGIVIQMFWKEHPPPHFHALYVEHEVLINITDAGSNEGFFTKTSNGYGARMG